MPDPILTPEQVKQLHDASLLGFTYREKEQLCDSHESLRKAVATHASEMRRAWRKSREVALTLAADHCYGQANSWSEADMHAIPHASMKATLCENMGESINEFLTSEPDDASIDAALASGDVQEGTSNGD